MTVKDPGRIPVGLFQGERLSDDAVRRLSVGVSRIVAFAGEPDGPAVRAQWSRVAPEIEVEVVPAVSDVREAIIECAKRKVIWLAAPEPRSATRFVAGALQGAAAATEFEIPSVAVHVLRDQGIPGPVAWLTQTGAMSGYGVLYAVAIAAMSGRSVTMIAPTELRAPRTPEAVEVAERYIAESGVEVERLSDPSPLQRVLGGAFGAVVHPVLDAPGGKSLLRPGELPAKSVAQGNPAAVVELLEKFPGDVIAVFDGVQLVYGSGAAARIAAGVALGITAVAGLGAVAAPAALAAEVPASAPATIPAGVTVSFSGGHNGQSNPGFAHIVNNSGTDVTLDISSTWHHSGNHPDATVEVHAIMLPAGGQRDVQLDRPIEPGAGKGGGGYHLGAVALAHVIAVPTLSPDQPTPDQPTPDQPTPDQPTPDQPTPDQPTPDQPTPDQPTPDQPKPDLPTPVVTPPVVGPSVPGSVVAPPLPTPDLSTPVVTPPVVGPSVPGPVVAPPLPKPDLPTPVVTPPVVGPSVPGSVVAPPLPKPDLPTPVVTPPVVGPSVPGPVVTPPLPTPDLPTPVVTPPVVTPPEHGPVVTPPLPTPDLPTPQSVPGGDSTTPGGGTQTPAATDGTSIVLGGTVSASTTESATSTPNTTETATHTGTDRASTTHAGTHLGGTSTRAATHRAEGSTEAQATGGPSELAHTGAGETGLIAGIAAALMAAGAGLAAVARRGADEEEGSGEATP